MVKLRIFEYTYKKFKCLTSKIGNYSVKTKLFISNLLLINGILLIVWIAGYNWISYSERSIIINKYYGELDSIMQNMDNKFTSLNEFSIKLSETRWVKKLMMKYYDPETEDILTLMDYKNELSLYSTLNYFVNTLSIYFNNTNSVMTTSGFTDTSMFFEDSFNTSNISVNDWERLLKINNTQVLIPSKVRIYGREMDGLVYLHTIPAYSEYEVRATLISFIEKKSIETITNIDFATSYVLDAEGKIVFCQNPSVNIENLIKNKRIKLSRDYFIDKKDVIFTTHSAKTGFTYIIALPEKIAMKGLYKVQLLVIFIFVTLVILGTALAYILALKNFRPVQDLISLLKNSLPSHTAEHSSNEYQWLESAIKSMLNEEDVLHDRLESQKPILKRYYLTKLVNEEKNINDELIKTLSVLGISFLYKMFCCFVISTNYNSCDKNEVDFIFEVLDDKGIVYEHVFQNDYIIVICNFYSQSQLSESILDIRDVIDNHDVILGIGNTYENITNIPISYMEALESTNYRILKKLGKVVQYADVDSNVSSYYYPMNKESTVIDHLTSGNSGKAFEVVNDLINFNIENRKITINAVKQLFYDIEHTLIRVAEEIDMDSESCMVRSEDFYFSNIDEMKVRLKNKIDTLCKEIINKKEKNSVEFNKSILEYIDQSYTDSNLSLSSLSEEFNLSQSHLSRYFKEKLGVNYVDYVNKKRVEYALELLKNSKCDINDIAQKAGFNNDVTFRRLFKKYYGASPVKYKETFIKGDV